MTIRETALSSAAMLAVLSLPAFAEGSWKPKPPKEPPPTVQPPVTPPTNPTALPPVEGDTPYDPYSRIYFGSCDCISFTTAWGFERLSVRQERAERQCEARRARIGCEVTDDSYVGGKK